MANCSRGRNHQGRPSIPPAPSGPSRRSLRSGRWPHPVDVPAAIAPDPTLHYIRCALSYQNQLLADIKALLQQLAERES